MNIIDESGLLAIATRLQRLSDQTRKDGAAIYKAFDIEFEPKWFPVVYTLSKRKTLGIVELATEIGYTHPSTISLLKEMEKEKLIRSKKDKNDERKRLVELTVKAEELIGKMEPVWELMISAMAEATKTQDNLLAALTQVEDNLKEQSFLQRALRLKNKS